MTWVKELGSLSIYSQFGMTVETVFTNNGVSSMSALGSVVLTSLYLDYCESLAFQHIITYSCSLVVLVYLGHSLTILH